jgi:integrase/recombinase XerD
MSPLPQLAALAPYMPERYLDGRTDGPLFATAPAAASPSRRCGSCCASSPKKAGLPQADTIKPHALRHGFITDSLDAGVQLQDVRDAVNHRDPRTTQRYNRRRRRHETHPGHTLAARLADKLASVRRWSPRQTGCRRSEVPA